MFPGTATRDFYRIGHFQSLLLAFSANKRHSSYPVPGHILDLTSPVPGHIDPDFSCTCPQKRLEEAGIDGENAGYQDGRSVCVI